MKVLSHCMGALALFAAATAAQAVTPSAFVEKAGASDMFEIDSAQQMVGSKNPAVAGFANKMLTDHAKSSDMVKAAAAADHLPPKKPSITVAQRADLTALKAVPAGKTKDDLYVKQQKASHADALALMRDYADHGATRHLRMTAGKIAPVVEQHQAMLAGM